MTERAYDPRTRQAVEEAKRAQSSAFNANAALLRVREANARLEDRCARLEMYVRDLLERVAALEARLGEGGE